MVYKLKDKCTTKGTDDTWPLLKYEHFITGSEKWYLVIVCVKAVYLMWLLFYHTVSAC